MRAALACGRFSGEAHAGLSAVLCASLEVAEGVLAAARMLVLVVEAAAAVTEDEEWIEQRPVESALLALRVCSCLERCAG